MCNMRNLDFYILNTINRLFLEDHRPLNHVNSSEHPFIREYMKTVAKYGPLWYEYQEEYPLIFQEVFSRTTFSSNIPESIISLAAVQLEEFVVNCHFGGHGCNRTRDFTRFFDQYYFNCFTYTAYQHKNDADFSLSEGIENGWSAILFSGSGMLDRNTDIRVLPGLHESQSPVSASEGVRVVIHPPDTQPFPFTEGYDVPPGFSASFGIKPRMNIRMGPPHGRCADRNPFGEDKARYRGISCQKMCLQSHVIKTCGCADSSLPTVPGTTVRPCRNNDEFPDSCMFNATGECLKILFRLYAGIQCARKTRDWITKNTTLMEDCKCFPPCDEILYDVSYSLSKWPASGYEGDAAYYDVFYIEGFKERFLHTPKYNVVTSYFTDLTRETTMKDFARLNIYVADSNVIKTQESGDYTTNQLVSDIGGQLGLWVGISIITLTEVIELMCEIIRYLLSAKMATPKRDVEPVRDRQRNGMYLPAVEAAHNVHHHEGFDSGDLMLTYYPDQVRR